ncbi:MAG: hypothetical protein ACI90V_013461, partial [Bacillariaceae sp.]
QDKSKINVTKLNARQILCSGNLQKIAIKR